MRKFQSSITETPWLMYQKANPQAKLRLFCFPYAGGGALLFRDWHRTLPPTVEVYPVQLPGRANRMREQPFTSLLQLVEAAANELSPYFDKPFAFFGHSMGAIIGFELTRHLRRTGGVLPRHLLVSGSRAPQIPDTRPPTYNLSEPHLLHRLQELKGTPLEVLENHELLQLILPTIRADLAVCQTYVYSEEPPLDVPVTVYGGLQDEETSQASLEAWQSQTNASFKVRMLPGDHFFLNALKQLFLQMLIHDLEGLV